MGCSNSKASHVKEGVDSPQPVSVAAVTKPTTRPAKYGIQGYESQIKNIIKSSEHSPRKQLHRDPDLAENLNHSPANSRATLTPTGSTRRAADYDDYDDYDDQFMPSGRDSIHSMGSMGSMGSIVSDESPRGHSPSVSFSEAVLRSRASSVVSDVSESAVTPTAAAASQAAVIQASKTPVKRTIQTTVHTSPVFGAQDDGEVSPPLSPVASMAESAHAASPPVSPRRSTNVSTDLRKAVLVNQSASKLKKGGKKNSTTSDSLAINTATSPPQSPSNKPAPTAAGVGVDSSPTLEQIPSIIHRINSGSVDGSSGEMHKTKDVTARGSPAANEYMASANMPSVMTTVEDSTTVSSPRHNKNAAVSRTSMSAHKSVTPDDISLQMDGNSVQPQTPLKRPSMFDAPATPNSMNPSGKGSTVMSPAASTPKTAAAPSPVPSGNGGKNVSQTVATFNASNVSPQPTAALFAAGQVLRGEDGVEVCTVLQPVVVGDKAEMYQVQWGGSVASRHTGILQVLKLHHIDNSMYQSVLTDLVQTVEKQSNVIGHPHIIKVHFGTPYTTTYSANGTSYALNTFLVLLEYVNSVNLRTYLKQHSELYALGTYRETLTALLSTTLQTAHALYHLHSSGLSHDSLESEHVLMTEAGCSKLMDYGNVHVKSLIDGRKIGGVTLTLPGLNKTDRSSAEMAYEQRQRRRQDISVWCLLVIEMFAGGRFWQPGMHDLDIMHSFVQTYNGGTGRLPRMPEDLCSLIWHILESPAHERLDSMASVLAMIEGIYKREVGKTFEIRWDQQNQLSVRDRALCRYHVGHAAAAAGLHELAVEEFRNAIDIDPSLELSYFGLGRLLQSLNQYEEAVDVYTAAMAAYPSNAPLRAQLGRCLYEVGLYETAIAELDKAIVIDPSLPEPRVYMGLSLQETGNEDLALAELQEVLKLSMDNHMRYQVYFTIGTLLTRLNHTEEAVDAFRGATLADPKGADAHFQLAVLLHNSGQLKEAEVSYRETLALQPDMIHARYNLGSVVESAGDVGQAVQHYKQVLQQDPTFTNAYLALGLALKRTGRSVEAVQVLTEGLRLSPDNASFHYGLGIVLDSLQNIAEAVVCYRQALVLKPNHVNARVNLGCDLWDMGFLQEAIDHFQEAVRIDPFSNNAVSALTAALSARDNRFPPLK
eukprot:GILJ01008001.1.p1 GENE.GILJ01008001.1~~GILJ01008001.1.p1  ORF type:complete len:1160 (+),score=173.88 GILJ01008001.1:91-3570(+)